MLLLLIAAVAALVAADPISMQADQDGRIMGGQEVSIEDFPYQVSITFKNQFFCGGSIISQNFVLTAGHCLASIFAYQMSDLLVRAGSNTTQSGGSVHEVVKVLLNDMFDNADVVTGDSGLLQVNPPFKFDATRQPVKLVDEKFKPKIGQLVTATGFGRIIEKGPVSKVIKAVSLPIISWKQCSKIYDFLDTTIIENSICAGFVTGRRDSCSGDSGGPLVYKGKQIGIVSWGYGCGEPGIPGVYESVSGSRKFITEKANV